MISKEQYVPILKCKEGEFQALNRVNKSIKDSIVPLVDLVPNSNKKFDDHIFSSLKYITKKWDTGRKIYIDGYMVQDQGALSSRLHPMEYIFNELSEQGFTAIPTIGNASGIEYSRTIKSICIREKKGTCIRILRKQNKDINTILDRLLDFLELDPSKVDLLIDLRSLEETETKELHNWCINTLNSLKYIQSWRSLILAGGNFPIDLTELKPDQIHLINRTEWDVWRTLLESGKLERNPSYSDYAISHPLMSSFEGIPNASASIRYTNESEFYIYRGKGTRQHSYDQFYDLSESLIYSSEYYGVDHCDGDKFIYNCGTDKNKPGSLTTWRWVGTIHHLTVVANQLRQFFRDFNAKRTS